VILSEIHTAANTKIDPVTDPAKKWNATTDTKAFPSSGAVPEARREKVTDALRGTMI
jgi:hypothetical protein